jgi:AraC family ethanolamine operon transcriptional activator
VQYAHQRLNAAQAGVHVTDIAMRLGFWEMGRFASDYRDMFGELPSVTLRNK